MTPSLTVFQRIYYCLLLGFLSVLSVSGTIALRNILHLVLLILLSGYVIWKLRTERSSLVALAKAVPVPVVLWCGYLLLFPAWAPDGDGAIANLFGKGMWGESILTWTLAWGSVLILGVGRLGLWPLALVSAVPVFIHLTLLLLAWGGVLQPGFYEDPSLQQVLASLSAVAHDSSLIHEAFATFPLGFRGIEPMHGNLGYPASQAMCLGLAIAFSAWRTGEHKVLIQAASLIAACFCSVVIAQSRAATYFGLMLVAGAFAIHWYSVRLSKASSSRNNVHGLTFKTWPQRSVMALGLILCLMLFWKVFTSNQAWYSMGDKISIGMVLENPRGILCNGLSKAHEDAIRHRYADRSPEYISALIAGVDGDGGRVLLARAGAELALQYPEGLNGGRDAYQIRMQQSCGHIPKMDFSHAHNAWVNMTLAVGFIGAILYASVFIAFARRARCFLTLNEAQTCGMALMLLSMFWIFRGMVDAVYQEHYLQMQAFFMLFIWLYQKQRT
nr:hypothetical protein [uncultured Rhodoferax sp.]